MDRADEDDETIYAVVVSDEAMYSIWPAHKAIPPGWRAVGRTGSQADCLAYVSEVWTDIRPLSVRRQIELERPSSELARGTTERMD